MKRYCYLITFVLSICTNTYGQNLSSKAVQTEAIDPATLVANNIKKFTPPAFDHSYYLQKSKAQKINGLVLITGGSVMSLLGIRSVLDVSQSHSFTKDNLNTSFNENIAYSRIAITGLVMMAGSIPYFISALKNKKVAGLKLTCQKTSFGASNKARQKVTGITFSIPIGK
ncbi:MAG: hypothetical protein ABIN01_14325 [Ferruginibacter sp.]